MSLSLDGKANKLAAMVRANLERGAAGASSCVPLFVGYDLDAADPARAGRIVSFDVAGGRYERVPGYHAVGSGSVFARSALKKLHDSGCRRADAPCGPRWRRSTTPPTTTPPPAGRTWRAESYPTVVTITRRGRRGTPVRRGDRRGRRGRDRGPQRADTGEVRTASCPDPRSRTRPGGPRRDDAVLRLGRAGHARPLRTRPQGHRAGSQRGGAHVLRRGAVRRREPVHRAAQGVGDLRPDRVRRGRPVQRVREPAHAPGSGTPMSAATPTTGATSPGSGWPTPTRRPSARSSPSSRSRSRWSCASPRWDRVRSPTSCTG